MAVVKLHIENIYKIGIRQFTVVSEFLQNISQYGIVDVPNPGMEFFSANAVCTITFINVIRVQAGCGACTVVTRIFQQVLARNKGPGDYAAP